MNSRILILLSCPFLLGVLLVCLAFAATEDDASPPAEAPRDGDAVQSANLIYAGTRSSVCFSDKFLTILARETTINTARKFKPVKAADSEIFDFPFVVMTGEGAFTLTDQERENLQRYLERGGFVLASAGCSSKQWDASFRREIAAIFPDRPLEPLSLSHDVFNTVYEITSLETKGAPAQLEGMAIGSKIVLIYSPDGLNDTSTMHGCCCCGGNEIRNAQKVNVNILAYALLQ